MRLIKAFGLAAAVATVAMALVGVSSATAGNTAICKTNEGGLLTCSLTNQWKKIHAVATNPVILSAEGNLTCSSSLLEFSLLSLGAPQVGHLEKLTWEKCVYAGFNCTITTIAPGLILFLKTAANLGVAQYHDMKLLIECGFAPFLDCVYEGLPSFHLLGASPFGGSPSNGGIRGGEESGFTTGPFDFACPPEIELDLFWAALEPVYIKS
jgi:hypothetical protein